MSLTKYKTKRDFKSSPEPRGGKPGKSELRFVVQKHDATRLHYDFRLEMEGVLKSWAVPKGPSTDPRVKRLAMMVEDHPYDYRDFEGIIPSGYGAGTVIVWDEGTYKPAGFDKPDKASQDKYLRAGLKAGKLHILLEGKKLKGEYALVKPQNGEENAWLLFKVKDQYASTEDITLKDKSVISKKTIAQVEKTSTNFYGENNGVDKKTNRRKAATEEKTAVKKSSAKRQSTPAALKKTAGKTPRPKKTVEPDKKKKLTSSRTKKKGSLNRAFPVTKSRPS